MIKVSYSAAQKYKTCPRAYYFHYIRKLREEKTSSALVFGAAIDEGLNYLLKHGPTSAGEAKMVFEKEFAKITQNGEKINVFEPEAIKFYKSDLDKKLWLSQDHDFKADNPGHVDEWITLRRKGFMMIDAYVVQVMPHIDEVISIQEYVKIADGEGNYIRGYIDFVARFKQDRYQDNYNPELDRYNGKVIIFDNKTSSIKYADDSVKISPQLGTYFENKSDKYEAEAAGYIVVPKRIRKTKTPAVPISIIIDEVAEDTRIEVFNEYAEVVEGHKYGNFTPNFESCNKRPFPCPYRDYCGSGSMCGIVQIKENKKEGR